VGVAFNRSPASVGLTSARPRISASTFPCVERWTRRAAFGGWPSPNRTLPTSGRPLSPREHRPTGSSRLPARLARPGQPPRTPVRTSARTARGAFRRRRDPRAPSFPGARDRNFAPPWIVWRKAPRTDSPTAHPHRPRQRRDGRPPARPTPFERESKMRATRLLLPTSFDRAPSSRAFPVIADRGPWPFT
jgi:hypothetical protein